MYRSHKQMGVCAGSNHTLWAMTGSAGTLARAVERALTGELDLSDAERADPDISFAGYLAWCARQPETPAETYRAWLGGTYRIAEGRC